MELLEAIFHATTVTSVLAADFPFSIPMTLLLDPQFSELVGSVEPFRMWDAFNASIKNCL